MVNNENQPVVSHLTCRELQAPLVSALIKAFIDQFGADIALKTASQVITRDAAIAGRSLAVQYGGNSLEELYRIVTGVWARENIMEIQNIQRNETMLRFDVTCCGYAEMYARLGIGDMGSLLSCNRDFAFLDGFNPRIKLVRTQTIMEGSHICDFCYTTQ